LTLPPGVSPPDFGFPLLVDSLSAFFIAPLFQSLKFFHPYREMIAYSLSEAVFIGDPWAPFRGALFLTHRKLDSTVFRLGRRKSSFPPLPCRSLCLPPRPCLLLNFRPVSLEYDDPQSFQEISTMTLCPSHPPRTVFAAGSSFNPPQIWAATF